MRSEAGYRALFCTAGDTPKVVDSFLQLRKTLFVDLLRWDLRTEGGREFDEFDTDSASYCTLYSNGELIGGFRAIRTDQPYLAQQIFPSLATMHPFPQRRDAWEISRFGVLPLANRFELAKINYALMFRFAYLRSASSLVAVADLSHERVLRGLGIRSARYGPPRPLARDIEGKPIELVAGEIRIADQCGARFQELIDHARFVEIADETLVLGRSRISA